MWNGVNIVYLYSPSFKNFEAIIHTFIAVLKARQYNVDILHIHAIGPGLMIPLARLLGLKVVVTHHGPDYQRDKWGKIAKTALWIGEWFCCKFAHEVIAISQGIMKILQKRCYRIPDVIFNGVFLKDKSRDIDFLSSLGLKSGQYILSVSRIEPEKGVHLLIDAYRQLNTDKKLVIAGYTNYSRKYSEQIQKQISNNKRILFIGFVTGEPLAQLYSHARLFVLPSFHEGLPIALLEAMSYGLSVLVSDIPANIETGLSSDRYFKCGDTNDLKEKMEHHLVNDISDAEIENFRKKIEKHYNWETIAEKTIKVYERALLK